MVLTQSDFYNCDIIERAGWEFIAKKLCICH